MSYRAKDAGGGVRRAERQARAVSQTSAAHRNEQSSAGSRKGPRAALGPELSRVRLSAILWAVARQARSSDHGILQARTL